MNTQSLKPGGCLIEVIKYWSHTHVAVLYRWLFYTGGL